MPINSTLVKGDPLNPESTDVIAQEVYLPLGEAPAGDAWRIMTGNLHGNLWTRVGFRFEVAGESEADKLRNHAEGAVSLLKTCLANTLDKPRNARLNSQLKGPAIAESIALAVASLESALEEPGPNEEPATCDKVAAIRDRAESMAAHG